MHQQTKFMGKIIKCGVRVAYKELKKKDSVDLVAF